MVKILASVSGSASENDRSSTSASEVKAKRKWIGERFLGHNRNKNRSEDLQRSHNAETIAAGSTTKSEGPTPETAWREQYAAEVRAETEAQIRQEVETELRVGLKAASISCKAQTSDADAGEGGAVFGECPICYEDMGKGRAIFITECGHTYHFKCLQDFDVTGESPCPLCRTYMHEPPIILKNRQLHADWFHRITREEAEAMLLSDGRHGTYLIRESHSRRGTFTLSFLHHTTPRHCRIFNTLDGKFAADSHRGFDTLQELVDWYSAHPIVAGAEGTSPVMLGVPCGKPVPVTRSSSAPAPAPAGRAVTAQPSAPIRGPHDHAT